MMTKYQVFGAAALSLALAMTPALARDGHGGGARGGGGVRGGGMSHGASLGASRNAMGGGAFQNRAVGNSFRGNNQVARGGQFNRGNQVARGGNFRGDRGGRRGGFGGGFAAGVALGGGYYGNDYYGYGYGDGAYDDAYGDANYGDNGYASPAYAYQDAGVADQESCAQRYHSYDPNTGTYLGYDGQRHLCQ